MAHIQETENEQKYFKTNNMKNKILHFLAASDQPASLEPSEKKVFYVRGQIKCLV